MEEPTYGSVVLVLGPTGTAYQRFFSDGLWHGTNGKVKTFPELLAIPSSEMVVIHYAPED